jgi:hypothetical protein
MSPPMAGAREKESNLARLLGSGMILFYTGNERVGTILIGVVCVVRVGWYCGVGDFSSGKDLITSWGGDLWVLGRCLTIAGSSRSIRLRSD